MKRKKLSNRRLIIAMVIILFIIACFSVNYFASIYARQKLEASLSKSQNYRFHFENLRVNVFTANASASHIYMHSYSSSASDSTLQFSFEARSLNLSGIGWFSLLFKKIICIGKIQFQHPVLSVKNFHTGKKKTGNDSQGFSSLYDVIHPRFESVHIGEFEVSDGSFSISAKDSNSFFLGTNSLSFKLNEVAADSMTDFDKKFFSLGNASASLKNFHANFTKGLYRLVIPSVTFSSSDSILKIDSILISPTVDKTLFAKKLGHQSACMSMVLANLNLHSARFPDCIANGRALADKLDIGYARIFNYRDKNLPKKPTTHVLHHTFLNSLHFKIDLRQIKVNNGMLKYESLNPGATEAGHVDFDNVVFELSNFSNLRMSDTMKVAIKATMMSKAKVMINMLLPLSKDEFFVTGNSGPYDMPIWNSMLKTYTTPMEIDSGHAESTTFAFSANEKEGTGTLTFKYADLHVQVLRATEQGNEISKIKSFIANQMIVIKNNPQDDVLRRGEIKFTRDSSKNLINYCWNLVFSGLKSSVGLRTPKSKTQVK